MPRSTMLIFKIAEERSSSTLPTPRQTVQLSTMLHHLQHFQHHDRPCSCQPCCIIFNTSNTTTDRAAVNHAASSSTLPTPRQTVQLSTMLHHLQHFQHYDRPCSCQPCCIIFNTSNTTTDRAAVNHAASTRVCDVWGKNLNELNCHLHPLDTVATATKVSLAQCGPETGQLFGNDCIAGNLVLQINKTDPSLADACNIQDNAAKVVRRVYVETDPSLADACNIQDNVAKVVRRVYVETDPSLADACNIQDNAAKVVRRVYVETDPSLADACNIQDNAAKVVRRVYVETDPSLADACNIQDNAAKVVRRVYDETDPSLADACNIQDNAAKVVRRVYVETDPSLADACNIQDNAAKVVRRVYVETDPSLADAELINVIVTYDGSWMKRGHNSAYGIGCVIDTVTGLVLDLTALSSYCQACSRAKARFGGSDTAKFHAWFRSHENDCNKNYTGAGDGMEVTAAEIMWERSMFKGFRYTTIRASRLKKPGERRIAG